MSTCYMLHDCPFFNDLLANMPVSSNYLKRTYCHTHGSDCARYMVVHALGRERVPPDLFPNEGIRAKRIISRG